MFEKRKDSDDKAPEKDTEAWVSPTPSATPSTPAFNKGPRSAALIGETIKIKGQISGDENLIIEGTVEGSVDLKKHDVTVGSSGNLLANISASVVRIDGEVKGDITGGEKVIVSASGNVEGNIVAPRVTLEDGAKFRGSIDMDPGAAATTSMPKAPLRASDKPGPAAVSAPVPEEEAKK